METAVITQPTSRDINKTDDVIITQPPNASMTHLENQADSNPKKSKRSLLSRKRRKAKYKRGGIILSLPGEHKADNDPTYNRGDNLLKNDVTINEKVRYLEQREGILLKVNDILVGVAEEGVAQLTLCQWLQLPQCVVVTSQRKGWML